MSKQSDGSQSVGVGQGNDSKPQSQRETGGSGGSGMTGTQVDSGKQQKAAPGQPGPKTESAKQ